MYSFEPNEEQQMLIDAVSRYAKGDLRPAGHEAEESKNLPQKLIRKGWELGVLQASTPETYGGFGERSAVTGVLAATEMAWGDLAATLAVMTPGLFTLPILLAGSEEQKKEWLEPVLAADWQPFSAALIEPSFDFDPNALKTTATAEGDSFVLNGVKSMVPFAETAQALIIYAALDGATRAFILPKDTPGFSLVQREKLMSLNALPLYRVKLENVKVAGSNLLPGDFAPILAAMRVANAALAIGVAQGAMEYARDYAKERQAFGVKIAQKQAIAFMLAEMVTEIEAMRLLTWQAAWMLDAGKEEAFTESYLAATGAADMVMMVTDRAVQILGGHGYIREYPVEMFMREGRGFVTFTGLAIV